MEHGVNLPAWSIEEGNRDRTRLLDPERLVRLRARLPEEMPLLAPVCLPALERMFDFHYAMASVGPVGRGGLHDAACEVLRCVQRELCARDDQVLERPVAYELVTTRTAAVNALIFLGSQGAAKKTLVELCGGRPLTVCVGGGQQSITTLIGERPCSFQGCLRVFPDAVRPSGRMWPVWCPECRNASGKHKARRDQARAFKDRIRRAVTGTPDRRHRRGIP